MFIRSISILLFALLCSTAYSQQYRKASRQGDSLRGPVREVACFVTPSIRSTDAARAPLKFDFSRLYDSTGNTISYSSTRRGWEYCYDSEGRLSCIAYSPDEVRTFSYDERGIIAEERYTDSDGEIPSLHRYDSQGNIIEEWRRDHETGDTKITTRSYDHKGRLNIEQKITESLNSDDMPERTLDSEFVYSYSTLENCIETPAGSDCSCTTLATVTNAKSQRNDVIRELCFSRDGKLRWRREAHTFNEHYSPLVQSFAIFDTQGRDSIVINKGVSFAGDDVHYPHIHGCPGCIGSYTHRKDSTQWLAAFCWYDQYGNTLGERIYIYPDLEALRTGNGTLARETTVDITVDAHGNWTRRAPRINGRLKTEEVRIITYYPGSSTTVEHDRPQELR